MSNKDALRALQNAKNKLKKKMEINPDNPLIKKLARLREEDDDFAAEVARQIYDNAMIQA